MTHVYTQIELSDAIGVPVPTIRKNLKKGPAWDPEKGGFPVEEWKTFLDGLKLKSTTRDKIAEKRAPKKRAPKKSAPKAGDELADQDMTTLKRLKELEGVRKLQIDNLTKAGKLVRVQWHEQQMAAMAGELQAQLKTMVRTLPPEIAGLETVAAQKVLERAVNAIIGKMAKG